ncbi:DUF2809 domain-containing protein [Rhizobium sp. XQZ8]|nr:DUF2809 domain-containing protein [Rhizobium populisoli]MBW6420260.1 DUF2809 domain-containing protein [Rhizobium populisoli]
MWRGWSERKSRLIAAVAVIAAGLALRRFGYDLGLPFVVVKYGGSILWGAMVYFLVAALLYRHSRTAVLAYSVTVAICIEMLRLYHAPWLDEFRLTTAGALLLGRVFSLWNILAYMAGILMAFWLDRRLRKTR